MWKSEYDKLWYLRNRENQIQRMKDWRTKNQDQVKQYRKEYHTKNKNKINLHKQEQRKLHPEKAKDYRQRPDVKRKAKDHMRLKRINGMTEYDKQYYQKNKARKLETGKIWRKNNPRSANHGSYELQDSMNNVRKRDNNTCQWFNCGLTFREAPIHVHHIFPKSEYPDLELVEQYMICYCLNHHWMWHKYRGDNYAKLLSYASRDDSFDLVRGRD